MIFRKNVRLKHYNYQQNGFYFVTVCTCAFRNLIRHEARRVVESNLKELSLRFDGLNVDTSVVMPNHIHAIFELRNSNVGLPKIVQAFKSITTMEIKKSGYAGERFWQPNYYEHVIRNENALLEIRQYIINNPLAMELKMEDVYG